jgi:hypothetical protein
LTSRAGAGAHVAIDDRRHLERARAGARTRTLRPTVFDVSSGRGRARRDRRSSTFRAGARARTSRSTIDDVSSGRAAAHVAIDDRRHLEQARGRSCQDRR